MSNQRYEIVITIEDAKDRTDLRMVSRIIAAHLEDEVKELISPECVIVDFDVIPIIQKKTDEADVERY